MATLADQTPGSIVKIKENGSLTNFLVLCNDYPVTGKALLRRQVAYTGIAWSTVNNEYSGSNIDNWCTNTYFAMLDPDFQPLISDVAIQSCTGGGTFQVRTLNRKIFLLSYTELNCPSNAYAPVEGSPISYFSSNSQRIATLNGSPVHWWTRSPYMLGGDNIWYIKTDGTASNSYMNNGRGVLPCFTLPSTIQVGSDGSLIPNIPPSPPAQINVPSSAMAFSPISITWSASTDPEGESVSYVLERSVNSQAYTQVYSGAQTQYSDTFSYPCSVIYRVKAVDESGGESAYTQSSAVSILMDYSNVVIGGDI